MRSPNKIHKIVSGHFLEALIMIAMQFILLLAILGIRAMPSSECPLKPSSRRTSHAQAVAPNSRIWYYEHVYDHQPAKLRTLTDKDDAAPLRSKIPRREREISIIIGTTQDRLPSIEATAMAWGGSLCLAVHALKESDISSLYTRLRQMHARVEALGQCRLDIQVVLEDGIRNETRHLYPVNGMRNAAWRMATTELVAVLDADFFPSPRMHEILTEKDFYKDLVQKATRERHAFVLPAFEFLRSSARSSKDIGAHFSSRLLAEQHKGLKEFIATSGDFGFRFDIPETKKELKQGWENGTIDCFHCSFSPAAHEPTNFRKFLDPATTAPFSISYRDSFEPYMILARESTPLFDERFRGYGKNKIAHAYECAQVYGMQFQTLPNVFIFEIPHPPSPSRRFWGRQVENDFRVAGLYRRFKSEIEQRKLEQENAEQQQRVNDKVITSKENYFLRIHCKNLL